MPLSRNLTLSASLGGLLLAPALWSAAAGAPATPQNPAAPAATAEGIEFFEKRIRPILVEQCYSCHSATSKNVLGGLLLDSRAALLKGGVSGTSLVPGNPEKSLLIHAVRQDGTVKMPPGRKLTAAQIADLETWVRMGAPDPRTGEAAPARSGYDWEKERKFWAFQPVQAPKVPVVKNKTWAKTAIDRFILAKLEAKGLRPVADTDRRTLIRRATFDLTGLPPTPREVVDFVTDKSPNAWEKVVDRLLASPAYGERWGRHWLDLVRYADTSGCNSDFPIPNAYKYRNWVIDSFNKDLPYDEFLRCQIAGDLLPAANQEERNQKTIATGYLAIARRFGSQANEFHLTIEDQIDNLGKTMLGLSANCARCHDHKFDPIPQKDYYALYGIFQSSNYSFPGTEVVPNEKDLVILASGPEADKARQYDEELGSFGRKIFESSQRMNRLRVTLDAAQKAAAAAPQDAGKAEELKQAQKAVNDLQADLAQMRARQKELIDHPVNVQRAFATLEGKPVDAKLQAKGDPKILGDTVPRGFLQVLGGQKLPAEEKGSGRLELAQWITDPKNPLTARVMANRIWQGHFEKGIVTTASDFGARGVPPTHPELLDYLADRFVKGGWSVKALHRQILLSHVYQLSSTDDPKNLEADAGNSLLWRYNRHRLDAESIRDAMLAASGALDRTMGGEHPFPPRSEWKYTQHRPFYAVYETHRRSVYLMQQRIRKQPFLDVFDGADPNSNTAERQVSTTAIQALFLMNDSFVHEQAQKLGERVSAASADPVSRITNAYRLCFGRGVKPEELKACSQYLADCRAALEKSEVKPEERESRALASLMRVLLSSNEFVFID